MSDPFHCFGSDDEEGDTEFPATTTKEVTERTGPSQESSSAVAPRRPADCGVLSFHPHTETSLLAHVRNSVVNISPDTSTASKVLEAVDDFCSSRHWMMHVGPEKGRALREEVGRSAREFLSASKDVSATNEKRGRRHRPRRYVCVELGTYCGYSAVLLADALRDAAMRARRGGEGAEGGDDVADAKLHLYTVEVSKEYAAVAGELIALAGLTDWVTQIILPLDTVKGSPGLADAISEKIGRREERLYPSHDGMNDVAVGVAYPPRIDFLFVDHDKDMYLPDLRALEDSGMIVTGTTVAADNVLFAQIDNYMAYVQKLNNEGIAKTRTLVSSVEYSEGILSLLSPASEQFRDGMEITTYLKDPSDISFESCIK